MWLKKKGIPFVQSVFMIYVAGTEDTTMHKAPNKIPAHMELTS